MNTWSLVLIAGLLQTPAPQPPVGGTGSQPPAPAVADTDAEQTFRDLFGTQISRVKATRDTDDDLKMAEQLMKVAAEVEPGQAVLAVFYDNIFQLASRAPVGHELARQALVLMEEQYPHRRLESRRRLLKLVEEDFGRANPERRREIIESYLAALDRLAEAQLDDGDAQGAIGSYRRAMSLDQTYNAGRHEQFKARLDYAAEAQRVLNQLEPLEARFRREPDNAALASELAIAYLVKLDKPQLAKRYAALLDEQFRRKLELAATPLDELDEDGVADVGIWYTDLADDATGMAKARLLQRAVTYLEKYLTESEKQGLRRIVAEQRVTRAHEQIDALTVTGPRWKRLLPSPNRLSGWKLPEDPDRRSGISYKDGVVTLNDQSGISYPVNSEDVFFALEIATGGGRQARAFVRSNDQGAIGVVYYGKGTFRLCRWISAKRDWHEFDKVTAQVDPDQRFVPIKLASIGSELILFVHDKQLARVKVPEVSGPGNVSLSVYQATGYYRNPRVLILDKAQKKRILAGQVPK